MPPSLVALPAREFAFVHQKMKRMLMVIPFFADGAQRRAQLAKRQQLRGLSGIF